MIIVTCSSSDFNYSDCPLSNFKHPVDPNPTYNKHYLTHFCKDTLHIVVFDNLNTFIHSLLAIRPIRPIHTQKLYKLNNLQI